MIWMKAISQAFREFLRCSEACVRGRERIMVRRSERGPAKADALVRWKHPVAGLGTRIAIDVFGTG